MRKIGGGGDSRNGTDLREVATKGGRMILGASSDTTAIRGQRDATDRGIDEFVYQNYSLTDEETRIVEGATNA